MTDGVDPLRVEQVSVSFGGLRALDDVSLRVPAAGIIGLTGPNGAGKTTLFNAVTGAVDPVRGAVWLFGQDVTRWAPHNRARLGVGRTFQRLELFGSLTVKENLVVAAESHAGRGGLLSDLLALPASIETRAAAEERATAVLAELGLDGHADAVAGELPTGLSRLVELGRALCTEPRLLLLDDPSPGGWCWRANPSRACPRTAERTLACASYPRAAGSSRPSQSPTTSTSPSPATTRGCAASSTTSPCWGNAVPSWPGRSRVANSRCSPSRGRWARSPGC